MSIPIVIDQDQNEGREKSSIVGMQLCPNDEFLAIILGRSMINGNQKID